MAKFYGKVGYVSTVEDPPNSGIWVENEVYREYSGSILRNTSKMEHNEGLNDNITIGNVISIVADPYANENFHSIRCVEMMGVNWKVNTVEVQYPRLILTIGGVYNG